MKYSKILILFSCLICVACYSHSQETKMKIGKSFFLFCVCILVGSNTAFAQKKRPKIETLINYYLGKGIKREASSQTPVGFAHVFAIALSFDKDGKPEKLYYSEKLNPVTKKLFTLDNSLLRGIQSANFEYKEYASQTVFMPFYFFNSTDKTMVYSAGFIPDFENLAPSEVIGKPVIFLKPKVDALLPVVIN